MEILKTANIISYTGPVAALFDKEGAVFICPVCKKALKTLRDIPPGHVLMLCVTENCSLYVKPEDRNACYEMLPVSIRYPRREPQVSSIGGSIIISTASLMQEILEDRRMNPDMKTKLQ